MDAVMVIPCLVFVFLEPRITKDIEENRQEYDRDQHRAAGNERDGCAASLAASVPRHGSDTGGAGSSSVLLFTEDVFRNMERRY
jgi:hypothetical protein